MTRMGRYLAPRGTPEMSFAKLKLGLELTAWAAAALDSPKPSQAQMAQL